MTAGLSMEAGDCDVPSHCEVAAVDPNEFTAALSKLLSGVTIVTARHRGIDRGMTATSVCSLSVEPSSIIVSTGLGTRTEAAIDGSGHLGVSILGAHQEALAARFARDVEDKFRGARLIRGNAGTPLFAGSLVTLDCQVQHSVVAWTHRVFFAAVVGATVTDGSPLARFERAFRHLAERQER